MSGLAGSLQQWAQTIQSRHGVNPWVFLALMTVCAPAFYYSIYRLGRAAVRREAGQLNLWGSVFLAATSLPYLYVIILGRGMPWYIYIVLAALLGQGAWSLLKRTRTGRGG